MIKNTIVLFLTITSFSTFGKENDNSRISMKAAKNLINSTEDMAEIYLKDGPCEAEIYASKLVQNIRTSENLIGVKATGKLLKRKPKLRKVLSTNLVYQSYVSDFDQSSLDHLETALSKAEFYSRAGGVFGPATVLEFSSHGNVLKTGVVILESEPFYKHETFHGKWKVLNTDKFEGTALIEITFESSVKTYELKFNVEQMDFVLTDSNSSDLDDGILDNLPSECEI